MLDLFGEVIVEKFILFDGEILIVGVRFRDGLICFYFIIYNL